MKVKLDIKAGICRVGRQEGDMPIKSESHLLYRIQQELKQQGYNVVKRLMWKDGHLVSDTQHYIRARGGEWAIVDSFYTIQNSAVYYRDNGIMEFTICK